MTAVLDKFRDSGVGYLLKVDQWHWAKNNNYKEITWTFDPLVKRNAKLNLLKLGAYIASYHPNFYGDMPDALNAGDESDRVLASWKVIGEKPISRNEIADPLASDTLIAIPEDIVAIRKRDLAENLKWRHKVRDQFVDALAKGGKVVGFSQNSEYVVRI
jgi:predicted GNAT superfamily acetyltransferase